MGKNLDIYKGDLPWIIINIHPCNFYLLLWSNKHSRNSELNFPLGTESEGGKHLRNFIYRQAYWGYATRIPPPQKKGHICWVMGPKAWEHHALYRSWN